MDLATPSIFVPPNHTLKVASKLQAKRSNNKSLTATRGRGESSMWIEALIYSTTTSCEGGETKKNWMLWIRSLNKSISKSRII
jgi:hypothetical protein